MTDARAAPINNIFPVISMLGFALAWYAGDIYIATAVLMGLMTAHVAVLFARCRHVPASTLVMWLLLLVLGGLTLLLRDKAFIQIKTSVVYSGLALALLIADLMDKNLPRLLLTSFFNAPAAVWRRLSRVAAVYFFLLAGCNYFVATYLSEAAWVVIKTFVFPAVTFLFTLAAIMYLYRYLRPDQDADTSGAKN